MSSPQSQQAILQANTCMNHRVNKRAVVNKTEKAHRAIVSIEALLLHDS